MKSNLEVALLEQIKYAGLPEPKCEYVFASPRKWRFDFAYPEIGLAIEVEGGSWTQGRHVRGSGFEKDCEKYNNAVMIGWDVLRFTRNMIESGDALNMISDYLAKYDME